MTKLQGPSGDWEGGKGSGSTLGQVGKKRLPEGG